MQVPDLLRNPAKRFPDRRAVIEGSRRLTFADVDRRADQLAAVLQARGVEPGDRVGAPRDERAGVPRDPGGGPTPRRHPGAAELPARGPRARLHRAQQRVPPAHPRTRVRGDGEGSGRRRQPAPRTDGARRQLRRRAGEPHRPRGVRPAPRRHAVHDPVHVGHDRPAEGCGADEPVGVRPVRCARARAPACSPATSSSRPCRCSTSPPTSPTASPTSAPPWPWSGSSRRPPCWTVLRATSATHVLLVPTTINMSEQPSRHRRRARSTTCGWCSTARRPSPPTCCAVPSRCSAAASCSSSA